MRNLDRNIEVVDGMLIVLVEDECNNVIYEYKFTELNGREVDIDRVNKFVDAKQGLFEPQVKENETINKILEIHNYTYDQMIENVNKYLN